MAARIKLLESKWPRCERSWRWSSRARKVRSRWQRSKAASNGIVQASTALWCQWADAACITRVNARDNEERGKGREHGNYCVVEKDAAEGRYVVSRARLEAERSTPQQRSCTLKQPEWRWQCSHRHEWCSG